MTRLIAFLFLLCMMINFSFSVCTSDQIRDIMIESCNLKNKKLFDQYDFSKCCLQDKIKICVRHFCH